MNSLKDFVRETWFKVFIISAFLNFIAIIVFYCNTKAIDCKGHNFDEIDCYTCNDYGYECKVWKRNSFDEFSAIDCSDNCPLFPNYDTLYNRLYAAKYCLNFYSLLFQ